MYNLLIVDDNELLLYTLSSLISDAGYTYRTSKDGAGAIDEIKNHQFELVILDYKLPGKNGVEILKEIKTIRPGLPIIMLTAFGEIKDAVESIRQGAADYITKPFNNDELITRIRKIIAENNAPANEENRQFIPGKMQVEENMLGNSETANKIMNELKQVAPTDMTVVLHGESGSGKEIAAGIIHSLSKRSSGPFVAVDCGAIPEALLESEFFGYEKGAFTDAKQSKTGKFEQANGGTIFLDEISNLSEINQMKLLRVIESKSLTRLGSTKPTSLNVRIITATNTNLDKLVQEKKFREDLYYRLNEYLIDIPPVRERKNDIPFFVNIFIKQANEELNKNVSAVDEKIMNLITYYNWPGNLRELRNAIRKSVLKTEGGIMRIIELPQKSNISGNGKIDNNESFKEFSKKSETHIILDALEKCSGNKTEAAKLLNMNIRTFYRKLKNLNK